MNATSPAQTKCLGMALSGGGVRAAAFHAGVLKWLAEKDQLKDVKQISTVSGGSLFVGLMYHLSDYKWPTSNDYLCIVLPAVRKVLTRKSLQTNALLRLLFNPLNWRYAFSRANIIEQSIERFWGVSATLKEVPPVPVWSINGTTAESGRRFRFKESEIGDYEIGYADASRMKLSKAIAVSAAFPIGIGPLTLVTNHYSWHKRENWGAKSADKIQPKFQKLHLYDGGIYDNLGMEPLFDVGCHRFKHNKSSPINFLIVSDAGAPYIRQSLPHLLSPSRLKQIVNVVVDQTRALRVRSYVCFLKNNPERGVYLQIGFRPEEHIHGCNAKTCHDDEWLSDDEIVLAKRYPTTLGRMKEDDFDRLVRHGYEAARGNSLIYLK
ncbi:MAG: patatin-like phospholipase family protein [Proteobacteria bacterium]|nr:patatin-like phospholipase family protein [Pseudomonadota bacterium]MBU4472517.1 patatin-like phospholipase family protein [Pseudomonadota bacterium]MCG2751341.1 patatin-like phospholipase family protein [Desulfobacteraceae bacterium]